MSDFTEAIDLAAERVGGVVLAANDDFFAEKENLLRDAAPIFIEGKYTDRGKWMDGWETRRRREPGHDWCLIRLGLPGVLHGVVVDTAFFKGNYPERCALEGTVAPPASTPAALDDPATVWTTILPESPLRGDSRNLFPVECPERFTHLRLRIYPDGGVARLRVHGEVRLDLRGGDRERVELDLAAVVNGGRVLVASDMFFGSRHNLIMPGPGLNMGDGWETKRRRGPGHDWVVVQLAGGGEIRRIEFDTRHFKGNAPGWCDLEAVNAPGAHAAVLTAPDCPWRPLLARTAVEPHRVHLFEEGVLDAGEATHVRLNIYPDGGVSRLRLYGFLSRDGARRIALEDLNALRPAAAASRLGACCGQLRWASELAARRPFRDPGHLMSEADAVFAGFRPEEWLDAFATHPRIGLLGSGDGGRSLQWSRQEQAGAADAAPGLLDGLAAGNRRYEEKFGFRFIIRATGRGAAELLDALHARLENGPELEREIARRELIQITHLRLEKLLDG